MMVAWENLFAEKSSSHILEVELRGLVEGLEAFGKERLQRKIKQPKWATYSGSVRLSAKARLSN